MPACLRKCVPARLRVVRVVRVVRVSLCLRKLWFTRRTVVDTPLSPCYNSPYVAAIGCNDLETEDTEMKKLSKAQQARNVVKAIVAVAQHLLEQAPAGKPTMSQTLRRYRVGYEKAVSYSKGATLDNGDALATAMRGLTPAQACELADLATGSEVGTHLARYASLS